MPKAPSAIATLAVVRRDHFTPVTGSPAVSYSSRNSIRVTMSAVFFHRCPAGTHATRSPWRDVVIEQVLPAACHGMRIQVEKRRQDRIAAAPECDRFQTGKQASLLFVEQAIEQQDGRLEFIGRDGEGGGVGDQRDGVGGAAGPDLLLGASRLCGGVQKSIRGGTATH